MEEMDGVEAQEDGSSRAGFRDKDLGGDNDLGFVRDAASCGLAASTE